MKTYLLCVLLLATIISSCKKDNAAYIDPNTSASLTGALVTSSGKIVFADGGHEDGLVKIYLRKDGVYVLALEDMNYRPVKDTDVYLSYTSAQTIHALKIFSATKLYGNIYYPLTAEINTAAVKYLIIQSDTDSSPAATAAFE